MKNFTRLFFLSALVVAGLSATAQNDISVSDLVFTSTGSGSAPAGLETSIYWTFTNDGDPLGPTDSIVTGVLVNANNEYGPTTFWFTGTAATGAQVFLPLSYGEVALYTYPSTLPSYEICAYAYLKDGSDVDSSNNLTCETVNIQSGVDNDWEATSVSIVTPTDLDGFDLDNGKNTPPQIEEASATFTNKGNLNYAAGTRIFYGIALDNDTIQLSGLLQNDVAPEGTTVRTWLSSNNIIPGSPNDSGTYGLCAVLNSNLNVGDDNDSNDVSCAEFTIIDSYDPFDPKNWPSAVEEVENSPMLIIQGNDQIIVEGIENETNIMVSDVQGRVVRDVNVTENTKLDVADYKSGIYVITAKDPVNGEVSIKKIVID